MVWCDVMYVVGCDLNGWREEVGLPFCLFSLPFGRSHKVAGGVLSFVLWASLFCGIYLCFVVFTIFYRDHTFFWCCSCSIRIIEWCMYTHMHIRIRIHIHKHAYAYTYTNMHMHIHIHTHAHTHTRTHT